jgi:hypothetical protein
MMNLGSLTGMASNLPNWTPGMMGPGFAALLAVGIVIIIFIAIALYVYTALVWYTIAKKLKYGKPWLAWIPFANGAMILQLGGFHWAWIFLLLIPILGWIALGVLSIISAWRIFEKRKYPGWLSLVPIAAWIPYIGGIAGIAYLVILGMVAWKDMK